MKSMYKVGEPLGRGKVAWEVPAYEDGKYYILIAVDSGYTPEDYSPKYIPSDRKDLLSIPHIDWHYIGKEDPIGIGYDIDA